MPQVGYDAKEAAAAGPTKKALGAEEAGAGGGSGEREELKLGKDVIEKLSDPDNKKWKVRRRERRGRGGARREGRCQASRAMREGR